MNVPYAADCDHPVSGGTTSDPRLRYLLDTLCNDLVRGEMTCVVFLAGPLELHVTTEAARIIVQSREIRDALYRDCPPGHAYYRENAAWGVPDVIYGYRVRVLAAASGCYVEVVAPGGFGAHRRGYIL